jgi:hypothetical protein
VREFIFNLCMTDVDTGSLSSLSGTYRHMFGLRIASYFHGASCRKEPRARNCHCIMRSAATCLNPSLSLHPASHSPVFHPALPQCLLGCTLPLCPSAPCLSASQSRSRPARMLIVPRCSPTFAKF